jgi:putative alpha-1,2-mannosidase
LQGRFWVTHAEFIKGGTLELETAESPNRAWGVAAKR